MTDSATSVGYITLSDSLSDVFNGNLILESTGSGRFYIAHRGTNNIFNGDVTFKNGFVSSNAYGNATYNGHIYFSNTISAASILFGSSNGAATLAAGKTISITGSGMTQGGLYLKNFVQLDTTTSISWTLTSSSNAVIEANTIFNAPLTITAAGILINQARFNHTATFQKTGSASNTSTGKNYFARQMTITNSGSSSLTFASSYKDTFMMKSTMISSGGIINVNHAWFKDSVLLQNNSTANSTTSYINIATTGNCIFSGHTTLDNHTSKMTFSSAEGNTEFDSTSILSFANNCSGLITLRNTNKKSSSAISTSQSGMQLTLGPQSVFNGLIDIKAPSIIVNQSTFINNATFFRFGGSQGSWEGGNIFRGQLSYRDSSTGSSHTFYSGTTYVDTFYAPVTYTFEGPVTAYLSNAKKSYYLGDITVNRSGSASVSMGYASNGRVILSGSANQALNLTETGVTVRKMEVSKSAGVVNLSSGITVSDSLFLTKGIIKTNNDSILITDNCKLTGGSDSSFIDGSVRKLGNDAFTFPLGSSTLVHGYHPLSMTAPSSTTDLYTAKYIPEGQTLGAALDTTIEHLNTCQYWTLNRDAGTSKVRLTLNWNNDSCEYPVINPSYMRVAGWNESIWEDLGSATFSGDSIWGNSRTNDSISTISAFTLSNIKCIYFSGIISKNDERCPGSSDGIARLTLNPKVGTPPFSYLWSGNLGVTNTSPLLAPGNYWIQATDNRGCLFTDSLEIEAANSMTVAVSKDLPNCTDSTGEISLIVSGGTGFNKTFYWLDNGSTNSFRQNLRSGEYSVLIRDSNFCALNYLIQLPDTNGPAVSIDSINNVTCFQGIDGFIKLEVSDSIPYYLKWSTNPVDTLDSLVDLRAGNYTVRVSDTLGCLNFGTFEISQPDSFYADVLSTNSRCGMSEGIAEVSVHGGTGDYTYLWSNEATTSTITDLGPGLYSLITTDGVNCSISKQVEILSSDGLEVIASVISNETCFLKLDGSAKVSVSGGTEPFTYEWYPKGGENDTASGLISDQYIVTVIDYTGCRQKDTVDIYSDDELNAYINVILPSSDTISDGAAITTIYGGTPPYVYEWSSGATVANPTGLGLGTDTLTITDSHGCSVKNVAVLGGISQCKYDRENPPPPSNWQSFPTCLGCSSYAETHKSITDLLFGAIPDDGLSDQEAFERASAYFNSLDANVEKVLSIPDGTYIVGRQTYPWTGFGVCVMRFNKINNLKIVGQGLQSFTLQNGVWVLTTVTRPKLIFEDCLKYGVFDPIPPFTPFSTIDRYLACTPTPSCQNYYCRVLTPGVMLYMNECNNVEVSNLELDGNLNNAVIGGGWGEHAIQILYDGIFVNASDNCIFQNISAHDFGLDGIRIYYNLCPWNSSYQQVPWPPPIFGQPYPPVMNMTINNCQFNYNTRCGLTWGGGMGLYVNNTEFNYTGQGRFYSNPGSGVDIEYEGESNVGNRFGRFRNSKFKYNKLRGMICDAGNPRLPRNDYFSRDIEFRDCIFVASQEGVTAYPNSRKFEFKDSYFYGKIWNGYFSTIRHGRPWNDDNLKFYDCTFDEEYRDPDIPHSDTYTFTLGPTEVLNTTPPTASPAFCPVGDNSYLIEFSSAGRVLFSKCKINTNFTYRPIMLSFNTVSKINSISRNRFDLNLFNAYGLNACDCIQGSGLWLSSIWGINLATRNDFKNTGGYLINDDSSVCRVDASGNPTAPIYFYDCLECQNIANGNDANYWVTGRPGHDAGSINFGQLRPLTKKYMDPVHPDAITDFFATVGSDGRCNGPISQPVSSYNGCSPYLRRGLKDEKIVMESITIAPVPATNTISIKSNKVVHARIINYLGLSVLDCLLQEGNNEFDIQHLKSGVYFIVTDSHEISKFIKM